MTVFLSFFLGIYLILFVIITLSSFLLLSHFELKWIKGEKYEKLTY